MPQSDAAGRFGGAYPARPGSRKSWISTHGRDLRFLGLFGLFLLLFYLCTFFPFVKQRLFPGYLQLNADFAAVLLNALGENIEVRGNSLVSPRFQVSIERGCDAVEPSALFCAAVLASPVSLLSRIGAAILGTVFLMVLNFVRVLTLYYTGAYFRKAFDVMHLDVWQALFIFLAILFWALWASWQTKRERAARNAHSPGTA
jgi:exosortase/archaeosortase family protein